MNSKNAEMDGRSGRSKGLRRFAAIIAVAVFGSTLALLVPGAKAEVGDLTHVITKGFAVAPGGNAVSPDGRFVYTWIGGDITVHQRQVDGDLRVIGSRQMDSQINAVVVTDNNLYAAAPAGVTAFSRDFNNGLLTFLGCASASGVSGCARVPSLTGHSYKLALSDFGRALYVGSSYGVTLFSRDRVFGSLTFVDCAMNSANRVNPCFGAPGLDVVSALAVNREGTTVFAGSRAELVVLKRSTEDSGMTFAGCLGNKKSTSDPDVSRATGCTPMPGLSSVTDIAVGSVHGTQFESVYVTAYNSDALSHYYFDRSTSKLALVDCLRDVRKPLAGCSEGVIYIAGTSSIDLSADGNYAYVTGSESGSVVPFHPAPGRPAGSLIQRGCFLHPGNPGLGCTAKIDGLSGAHHVAVAPDGSNVYVSGSGIAVFKREMPPGLCQTNPVACQNPGPGAPDPSDTSAPETQIDSAPKPKTRASAATFTFSATEDATFECSLDGADFELCSSPTTYTGVARGAHTFQVVAVDAAGNRDGSPAASEWVIKRNQNKKR